MTDNTKVAEFDVGGRPGRHSLFQFSPNSFFGPGTDMEMKMRGMFHQLKNLERDMDSYYLNHMAGQLQPRLDLVKPEVVTEGGQHKYKLNLFMGDNFAPKNVKVHVKDGMMTIEAKDEKVSEDGHHRVYNEVSRKFTLPKNLNAKDVKSHLTHDGVLHVEAPLPDLPKPQEIPIIHMD